MITCEAIAIKFKIQKFVYMHISPMGHICSTLVPGVAIVYYYTITEAS